MSRSAGEKPPHVVYGYESCHPVAFEPDRAVAQNIVGPTPRPENPFDKFYRITPWNPSLHLKRRHRYFRCPMGPTRRRHRHRSRFCIPRSLRWDKKRCRTLFIRYPVYPRLHFTCRLLPWSSVRRPHHEPHLPLRCLFSHRTGHSDIPWGRHT